MSPSSSAMSSIVITSLASSCERMSSISNESAPSNSRSACWGFVGAIPSMRRDHLTVMLPWDIPSAVPEMYRLDIRSSDDSQICCLLIGTLGTICPLQITYHKMSRGHTQVNSPAPSCCHFVQLLLLPWLPN